MNALAKKLLDEHGWTSTYLAAEAIVCLSEHRAAAAAHRITELHALPGDYGRAYAIAVLRPMIDQVLDADPGAMPKWHEEFRRHVDRMLSMEMSLEDMAQETRLFQAYMRVQTPGDAPPPSDETPPQNLWQTLRKWWRAGGLHAE